MTPPDTARPAGTRSPEAILVETSSTDPIAPLSAASVEPSCGRLLVVIATFPRKDVERRLSESGSVPENIRIVEFAQRSDSQHRAGEQVHHDLAGLSMELVGQFDWLAEEGNGVVYLDSLEPYVSAAGLESTFRFLVIVAARARSVGVTLVARLGDGDLGPVPVETLREAFDRTVTRSATDEAGDTDRDGTGGTG